MSGMWKMQALHHSLMCLLLSGLVFQGQGSVFQCAFSLALGQRSGILEPGVVLFSVRSPQVSFATYNTNAFY
jgi:hypothetical protein